MSKAFRQPRQKDFDKALMVIRMRGIGGKGTDPKNFCGELTSLSNRYSINLLTLLGTSLGEASSTQVLIPPIPLRPDP